MNNGDLYKLYQKLVIGITIPALLGLFAFLKNVPNRSEVSIMIQNEAPYVKDRNMVQDTVRKNTKAIEDLTAVMAALRIEIAVLNNERGVYNHSE